MRYGINGKRDKDKVTGKPGWMHNQEGIRERCDMEHHEYRATLFGMHLLKKYPEATINIVESAEEIREKELEFSTKAGNEIGVISDAVIDIVAQTVEVFKSNDIEKALQMAKAYADAHPDQPPLITINSWNEWTESSYLQPDQINGYGYLEAVRDVFLGDE